MQIGSSACNIMEHTINVNDVLLMHKYYIYTQAGQPVSSDRHTCIKGENIASQGLGLYTHVRVFSVQIKTPIHV